MLYVVESLGRKTPGPKGGMPASIKEAMLAANLTPTLTQLALATGIPLMTLKTNLSGEKEMRLSTALKLAAVLNISVEDLAQRLNNGQC